MDESILQELLNNVLGVATIPQIEQNYLSRLKGVAQWICYSDYCLDDKHKPNNVVTFSIIPYITEFKDLDSFLKENAKQDIKKSQVVNPAFIEFLKKYPLINFSFIINDRKLLYGKTGEERKKNLLIEFNEWKNLYTLWKCKMPEQAAYFNRIIKKINCCIENVEHNKKTKLYLDMFLISFFGAYVSNIITSRIDNIEVYGWLPDRDKINEIEDNLVATFFHHDLVKLMKGKSFKFITESAKSNSPLFYDNIIKIPDYIAGTIADFNLDANTITMKKFDTLLTEYMADNAFNNYVFKLFVKDGRYMCDIIEIRKR